MPDAPPPVPIPPDPTSPTGGDGQVSEFYGLPNNYVRGTKLRAADFDKLVGQVDVQVAAALAGVGSGTLIGGDWQAPSGLTLTVNAWRGILPESSERFGYAGAQSPETDLTIDPNVSFVVWATPVSGEYPDAYATPYETAQSGIAEITVVTDGTDPDGGTPLFSGTSSGAAISGLTDERIPVGTQALRDALAALQLSVQQIHTVIGLVYFPLDPATGTPASIAARLSAIEAALGGTTTDDGGGGGGGGGDTMAIYWDGLPRSSTNAQTIAAYVQSQLPTKPAPVTPSTLTDDVIVTNELKLLAQVIYARNSNEPNVKALDAIMIIPGITDDAYIDYANSTVPIDPITHTIG